MQIGVALPQMARDYGPGTTVEWSRAIDEGPFSSVSAGERVTFSNPEMVASLAAAAAVTRRVRIMANVWVLPAHPAAMVAQQVGTLDQLAPGRLSLGVGVGGREHDYQALGAPLDARHARLDTKVAELRQLLAGEPPFPGADPVGPALTGAIPEILAAAMGPKSMARAARWADGVTGFTVTGRRAEMESTNQRADEAWAAADRPTPRKVTGCFVALGIDDPQATLRDYVCRYLAFAGDEIAAAMADEVTISSPDAVARLLDDAEGAGCDELILVPATADRRCLDAMEALVSRRGGA
ncbi:LLM class flavin-dependent oxidoreductase [Nocardioides bizhenqiangii]|uniref:LLM class flavin-dependent oxidoreductase n=1 Tax=Nocardioides bizhenqiangii TaxID=3095076 RepID=A0ABZ0ZX64_9ACTN|nr:MULTISPECIES: LLM class flavin-dependent oxidoreductase [unclassified Nocardioides]MDZ5622423.1 LLM class flavin-dependent oxidoreductase [Nocardioides sp. HM23]WQQ28409.1 LLM class flavin-dependent oxidoreductase [Nocardioides sp. HM61]